jgi:LEA14-like dessication related protein
MGKWSWGSALAGAACATATLTAMWARPRNPTFQLISISLSSFHLNLPLLDLELMLTVHVANPNPVAIQYKPALVSISYSGTHLGTAQIDAGSQSPNSCQILQLSARLDGLEMAHHAKAILADVARRSMVLDSTVDIEGVAQVWQWPHRFSVHLDSHVVVDPVFLEVVEQNNQSETQVYFA